MVKKKKRGRPIKWHNNPVAERIRKGQLEYYYRNREARLAYGRKYHKKIKDFSIEHNISFEEARKELAKKRR